MKNHSIVIFDLGDHSPSARARVVEYLANRFEISPDIVGARLRDLPFVLRNWLEESEIAEVKASLSEHRCSFDIVENLGNVADLTPPTPSSLPPAHEPPTATAVAPEGLQTKAAVSKPPEPLAEPKSDSPSLMNFELTEPTAAEVAVVDEQIAALNATTGAIGDAPEISRSSVEMPSTELTFSFDEAAAEPSETPSTPAPAAPTTAPMTSGLNLNISSPGVEGPTISLSTESVPTTEATPPGSTEEPTSPTPPPAQHDSATFDFDLSLSEPPVDIQPLVEEFDEIIKAAEDNLDLKPVIDTTSSSPQAAIPLPPKPSPTRLTAPAAAKDPVATQAAPTPSAAPVGEDDASPAESSYDATSEEEIFTAAEEELLTRSPLPLKYKQGKAAKRTFTLFHALGFFVLAVGIAFYTLMPSAQDQDPQLTLSEGSIDKLLKEQEQILNPVATATRSISRWAGKVTNNEMSTTINLSLDLNQVMLNDISGYASLELFGAGKEPAKLTAEEIVARKPFPIWVTRFEASLANFTPQQEQSGDLRNFEATGEARVYLKQGDKTSRLISPLRVTGTLNLESKKLEGKWQLYHGMDLPTLETDSFAENLGNSFKFYYFGSLEAEPVARPAEESNGASPPASSTKSKKQSSVTKG